DFYQSSFSNYGDGVSIFAPGSWVFSTDTAENGGYSYKSGTSMAAPVVTGIAALTWSVNPALTGAEVKAIICDPANTVYRCVNHYWEDDIDIPSYPMINAKLSVEAAIKTLGLPEEPTEPISEPITGEPESETELEAQVLVHGNSEDPIVERFRGEIGE
ncbi:MAG: S8 family serine peptidase, partial [Clostridia bacterium]|nr:S8 family serine peptidase [Clostridia bacterium]